MNASKKYDIVDVHVTSSKYLVDSILEHPLLDGKKKYTVEITEFTVPLGGEPPLERQINFDTYDYLAFVRVFRKHTGEIPGVDDTLLRNVTDLGAALEQYELFKPDSVSKIQTPCDMVFYLQEFFDNIKAVYSLAGGPGILAAEHGGGGDVDPADVRADDFVKVKLTPNGTIRLFLSDMFCTHFFLDCDRYAQMLFGFTGAIIAFRKLLGVQLIGEEALVGQGNIIIGGGPEETVVLMGSYPLTRFFDHRVRLEIDSGGMPVPNVLEWTTDNKQSISHAMATFPISQKYTSSISLNRFGAADGNTRFSSSLLQGDVVWRRAEDKVSERYNIMNSQFFQNIRLEIHIVRREWNQAAGTFSFKRRTLTLNDGESWTAKLRFRTMK